jgi:protocatechuate 3,4-dioxygenase beta subunit
MRRHSLQFAIPLGLVLGATAQEPWLAEYAKAQQLAAASNAEPAVAALEAAFAAGLADAEKVLHDPQLESLHGDAKFRSLLRERMTSSSLRLAGEQEPGERILVRGVVIDASGLPAQGATILAYQADASGKYTREKPNDEPNSRLFGFLVCDEYGRFELSTIFPGYYNLSEDFDESERYIPAHIHLRITTAQDDTSNLQLVFADDPRMGHEHWRQWAAKGGHPIARWGETAEGRVADAAILLRD